LGSEWCDLIRNDPRGADELLRTSKETDREYCYRVN
jgi:hypothetical protein